MGSFDKKSLQNHKGDFLLSKNQYPIAIIALFIFGLAHA